MLAGIDEKRLYMALEGEHMIPVSYGVQHAAAVLMYVLGGFSVAQSTTLTADQVLAIQLAALLHNADDPKYFGHKEAEGDGHYPHARAILDRVLTDRPGADEVRDLVFEAIALVSISSVPPRAEEMPEILFPRNANRLLAIGILGIVG